MQSFPLAARGYGPVATTRAVSIARSASSSSSIPLRHQFTSAENQEALFSGFFAARHTMKSWQLIAVVGDALQVRHSSRAGQRGENERDC